MNQLAGASDSNETPISRGPRRVALITGGAKRIGKELAVTLARARFDVAFTYRDSADQASKTAKDITDLGARSMALKCDVRSESDIHQTIAATTAIFGRLDLLINNAAVFESVALAELTLDQWDRAFETNTRGPFLMAREALHHLKATQGRIINMGSLGGHHPWPTHAHYCASKAALEMLTKTMAKAFAPDVSVNSVAPGYIDFGEGNDTSAHFAAKTPMGGNGTAADVAAAVLFFATGPHSITGQILTVDGGLGLT